MLGRKVDEFVRKAQANEAQQIQYNASRLIRGYYFVQLRSASGVAVQRLEVQ